jgi:hypothetical protein
MDTFLAPAPPPVFGLGATTPAAKGLVAGDWRLLLTDRPNVILIGALAATNAVLWVLAPNLPLPVWRCCARTGFVLPAQATGTLVVHQAAALTPARQIQLLQWLSPEQHPDGVEVIATSDRPIAPMVDRGAFLPNLYFALNGVTLYP